MAKSPVKFPGKFISSEKIISPRLKKIKALVFDWDGVFNNGEKSADGGSNFSEVDSMGTNLLRYSFYLNNNKLPVTAIISGEKNQTAFFFSRRECFHYSFFKMANNKLDGLKYICEAENIKPEEVLYVFDDVLDLPIAEVCGVRILINQKVNPLFTKYCVKHKLADYISGNSGGNFAVREVTEMLMHMDGNYDKVMTDRKNSAEKYKAYLGQRQSTKTSFFTAVDGNLAEIEL
jgi:3-deoxy-D-manno-octulosonate 8-phosphate phosphatase (KDO 8-P phosphatase)